MSDAGNEKKKPSKRLKKSENTEKVKRKSKKESQSDITVKKRGERTARDEKNDELKPLGNEPRDPSKPLEGDTKKFENGETYSEINRDPPSKEYHEKEPIQAESKNTLKKRAKCPLSSKFCKRNKRDNKKGQIDAPENGTEVSAERFDITKENIEPELSSSKTKRIRPPKGYVLIDKRVSSSADVDTPRPLSQDGKEPLKPLPGALLSAVRFVPPPKGFHEREPILLEGRRCYSESVDIPCSVRWYEYEPKEATWKPSTVEHVPRPQGYQENEPIVINRRRSSLDKTDAARPNRYIPEQGKEESPKQFKVSKGSIKPETSYSEVHRVPPPKEPVRVKRKCFSKKADTPRPLSYDEYQDGEEPSKRLEGSEERMKLGISPPKVNHSPPSKGYHERAPVVVDRKVPDRRKYEKNKSDDSAVLATAPCKPCSAAEGLQRDDLKPFDSFTIIRTPKKSNFMRCDNEKCPSNIELKNKSGGRKRQPDEPAEGNYDDVDIIFVRVNRDSYERSSTDLIAGLALCGCNKGESAAVTSSTGSTKKKESRELVNYDDVEHIEPLYPNKNINEVRTLFITDPRLLQRSSNYEQHFDDISRDSRTQLIKKYTYLITPSGHDDTTKSSYSSNRWSERQLVVHPTKSDKMSCREARNEMIISSVFTVLLILFILFILLPPLVR